MMRRASTFTDFIHAQVEKSDPHAIEFDKFRSREIAAASGIATPQLYATYSSPRKVDFAALPDRFVLKPTNRCSKVGVHLLQRADGGYYELFSRSHLSEEAIIARLESTKVGDVIAEELVAGPTDPTSIPFDYKLYTFGESVPFILQIDRNHDLPRLNFFDGSFRELGAEMVSSKWRLCKPGAPAIPKNASDLTAAAQAVSRYLKRPFISVDLYSEGSRVLLGEATPAPGGPYYGRLFYFLAEFDLALGEHWSKGCERLGWEIPMLRTEPPQRGRLSGTGMGGSSIERAV